MIEPMMSKAHEADLMQTTTWVSQAATAHTMNPRPMSSPSFMSDSKLVFQFPETQQALEHFPAVDQVLFRPLHDLDEAGVCA